MISINRPQSFSKEDKNKKYLFVYGTLKNPKTRDHVLKHKEEAKKAILSDYNKKKYNTLEGKDYYSINKDPGKSIIGQYFPISNEDLKRLESWEDEYSLISIILDNGISAYTFQLKNQDKVKGKINEKR